MEVHVLNGDALRDKFRLDGQVIVCRECLIEGPVRADSLEQFWNVRAAFLTSELDEQSEIYFKGVKEELDKLRNLDPDSIVNLWFEHDLFCQVNMWFVLHFMSENKLQVRINRVMPPVAANESWSGFGRMQHEELMICYNSRIQFTPSDIKLGIGLWQAYQQNDFKELKLLSRNSSACFAYLDEVCEAHIHRFPGHTLGRPQRKLKAIMQSGVTSFNELFKEFLKTESIYGFGDVQIKNMLTELSTK